MTRQSIKPDPICIRCRKPIVGGQDAIQTVSADRRYAVCTHADCWKPLFVPVVGTVTDQGIIWHTPDGQPPPAPPAAGAAGTVARTNGKEPH